MPFVEYPADLDLKNQSFVVPGSKKEGRSGIYKSSLWPVERLAAPGEPRTLVELFDQSVARHPNLALFLRRNVLNSDKFDEEPVYGKDLIPTSYAAVQARRDAIGSALLGLERSGRLTSAPTEKHPVSPPEITFPNIPSFGNENRAKNGARRGWAVGVWSKNREEWQVVDIAAQSYGLVSVSLYETLGPDVGKYIINHCPLPIVFASANHLTELLKIAPECPTLRVIVCMDKLSASQRKVYNEWAATVNVEFLDFAELELYGQTEGVKCEAGVVPGIPEEHELDLERIVTISYTSGTTGDPKGVVLTNRNFTRAIISNALGANIGLIGTEWRFLSYLPLSHIYERFLQLLVIYCDGTIGFTTGDTLRLLEDAQIIKPHYMPGVPRIFNRLHAAIKAQMDAGGLKGALLTRAVNTKLAAWKEKGQVTHAVYDALVFRKIKALLGGEILFLSSGSAPLAGDVHQMIKVAFATDAIQGFGMTETVGTCSKGIAWDVDAVGTCGPLQPCNEAVLMDVPEMGYTSNDKPNPRGELCLRGENITPGYLHDPVNTAKTIDSEGWMHTGDVAEFDSAGRLKIIDRIKNVVKLSQGEYVALEKLEGMYALNPVFAQLLVHGDSTRSSLIGVGVLDPVNATGLIKSLFGKTVAPTDLASIDKYAQDKRFKEAVLASLGKISKKYKLNGFETIKAVHLTATPFPESILTPTMKVKRAQAAKMYKAEIDAAYQDAEGGKTDSFAKF